MIIFLFGLFLDRYQELFSPVSFLPVISFPREPCTLEDSHSFCNTLCNTNVIGRMVKVVFI